MAEAVIAQEEDAAMAAEAQAALAARGADNAIVETGPLVAGIPAHGPYDAIMVEGGVGTIPEALTAQLKVGGRIAAIFMDGTLGQARLGLRGAKGVTWRRIFDATAPILPGFEAAKVFEF